MNNLEIHSDLRGRLRNAANSIANDLVGRAFGSEKLKYWKTLAPNRDLRDRCSWDMRTSLYGQVLFFL